MHVTHALAQRIERAEIDFCATAGGVGTPSGIASLDVGGGRALYGHPESPLNKVLGLGVGCEVTDVELDVLDHFYRERQSPSQIELCPLAVPDLAGRLCERGYVLRAFENELGAPIGELRPRAAALDTGVTVTRITDADDDLWLTVVAHGFAAAEVHGAAESDKGEPAVETVEALRRMMTSFSHPSIARYLVRIDGEAAGAGASYEYEHTLGIFGTATLRRFRRRGVQQALVARAIVDASPDVDLAIATTEPGSTSQRTFERLGFRLLYTRAVMIKPAAG